MCVADDRLVTILRHHNFLKELQEIAVEGESQIAHSYDNKTGGVDGKLE